MTQITESAPDKALSAQVREATWDAHREAEHTPFIQDLLGGRLGRADYARLVVQHLAIYEVLEAAVQANTDPVVAPFLAPELTRTPSLRDDLAFLTEPGERARMPVLPATVAYREHLADVCFSSSPALLAHHYVRYLGDLSGGRVVCRVLRKHLDFTDDRGTRFYAFAQIASPRTFKIRYRTLLDGIAWDDATRTRFIDEAQVAFRMNADVLYELGADAEP